MSRIPALLKQALGEAVAYKQTKCGYAVCLHGAYRLDGDSYTFYLSETADGFKLEDAGDYELACNTADSKGNPISKVTLDALMLGANACIEDGQIVMRCRANELGASVVAFTLLIFRLMDALMGPENH